MRQPRVQRLASPAEGVVAQRREICRRVRCVAGSRAPTLGSAFAALLNDADDEDQDAFFVALAGYDEGLAHVGFDF